MFRKAGLLFALALGVSGLTPGLGRAQLVTTMVDGDGGSFPCATVGPLAPIAQEYCVRRTEAQGSISKRDLGGTGLIVGVEGPTDGIVTAIAPGSPAAGAGVAVGDALVAVDGQPVRRPPADVARQRLFGTAGATVRLTLARGPQTTDVSYRLAPAPEPPDTPHSPNFLIGMHPVVNWRGKFVPCMGAGVLGPAAIQACLSHFGRLGYVKVSDLGAAGLSFDPRRTDAAVVATVDPGSAATAAGVRPGDVVTQVNGQPLVASLGKQAQWLLFGKIGERRDLTLQRAGRPVSASIVLVKPTS